MLDFLRQFDPIHVAIVAKPFVLLVLTLLVLYPARVLARRYIPDGRMKRLLLREI